MRVSTDGVVFADVVVLGHVGLDAAMRLRRDRPRALVARTRDERAGLRNQTRNHSIRALFRAMLENLIILYRMHKANKLADTLLARCKTRFRLRILDGGERRAAGLGEPFFGFLHWEV